MGRECPGRLRLPRPAQPVPTTRPPGRNAGCRDRGRRGAGHGVAILLKIYAHSIEGRLTPPTSGPPDALGVQDTQPESGDQGDDDSEQAPEMPGQRHVAGRTVSVTAPTVSSVDFSAPKFGAHGHIADGENPETSLEAHNRRSAADISAARTLRTAQTVTAGSSFEPRSGPPGTSPAARPGKRDVTRNAWHLRVPAVMLDPWKFPRTGEISRASGFKSPLGHGSKLSELRL